jgi:transcriptional regulator with XRE-family HTH domain
MKERLIQLLDLEQLTPSKFADIIGVQRSSVSHVISGRNNPSFDFIQKTLTGFPGLNAEWLILGQGAMYDQMGREASGNLFEAPVEENLAQIPVDITGQGAENDFPEDSQGDKEETITSPNPDMKRVLEDIPDELEPEVSRNPGNIVQVMVFYEDDTFRTYKPSK